MQIVTKFSDLKGFASPLAVTIGNFDGFHLGHQSVINTLKSKNFTSVVITFAPHPVQFFKPDSTFKKIFSPNIQAEVLSKAGVDILLRLEFNAELAGLGYSEFLESIREHAQLASLVVGYDLQIGKDRQGDINTLKKWCEARAIDFQVVPPVYLDGQIVSSTRIRKALEVGGIGEANRLLGHAFSLRGVVVHGDKRGRKIGFPTANLIFNESLLPKIGVYKSTTRFSGRNLNSITNIGRSPTFKTDDLVKVETHIFDFNEDIYGSTIGVELISFIRPELKFSGVDQIISQIEIDIAQAKRKNEE